MTPLSILLALLPALAHAELGGNASSVGRDALHFHARAHQAQVTTGWSVQALEDQAGTTIREYLDASGHVFAVAWSGPTNPDLRQLLGSGNFSDYAAQAPYAPRHGRGFSRVETAGMICEIRGRMPHFHGRAWLPALLPAGFSTNAIE